MTRRKYRADQRIHPKIQEMISAAESDIRRLRRAKSSKGAREAWVSFLEHANRALNRLEGYAKRTNQTPKYKDLIGKEIWANDLTKYMRAARNAHEHGVEDLGIDEPYNDRIIFPDGRIAGPPIVYGYSAEGKVFVMTAAEPMQIISSGGGRVISLKPGIRMVPIIGHKGETIMPPHVGALEAEDESDPSAVARVYLAWVVAQVSTFD
jgi:hypothetical protein